MHPKGSEFKQHTLILHFLKGFKSTTWEHQFQALPSTQGSAVTLMVISSVPREMGMEVNQHPHHHPCTTTWDVECLRYWDRCIFCFRKSCYIHLATIKAKKSLLAFHVIRMEGWAYIFGCCWLVVFSCF